MESSDKQKVSAIMEENCIQAYFTTCDGDQPVVRPVSPIVETNLSILGTPFIMKRNRGPNLPDDARKSQRVHLQTHLQLSKLVYELLLLVFYSLKA